MLTLVRAGLTAALLALAFTPALAADGDKAFQRGDLDQAAIKLEAQIKNDAGTVTKPLAQLRKRRRRRLPEERLPQRHGGARPIGHRRARRRGRLAAARARHPADQAARRPRKNFLLERASTAAYIAYQRAKDRARKPTAWRCSAARSPTASYGARRSTPCGSRLLLRESADLRGDYETAARASTASACSTTPSIPTPPSPRACFQFSEELPGKRTDFSPFVAVAGNDKPALSADDKQLCVEGLKHGERYTVTLARRPAVDRERDAAEVGRSHHLRARPQAVRALRRQGLRAAAHRPARHPGAQRQHRRRSSSTIYRIGDRNLIDTVLGSELPAQSRPLRERAARQPQRRQGVERRARGRAEAQHRGHHRLSGRPGDRATSSAGVYVMTARRRPSRSATITSSAPTQWFIVSDLGLTAYSGHDGIDVFVHSLASAAPPRRSRCGWSRATTKCWRRAQPTRTAARISKPGWRAARAGSSPAADRRRAARATTPSSVLKGPAFDLTDRGVAGRQVPAGLDAFVYTERGVYRTGETVHVTALLRDAHGDRRRSACR